VHANRSQAIKPNHNCIARDLYNKQAVLDEWGGYEASNNTGIVREQATEWRANSAPGVLPHNAWGDTLDLGLLVIANRGQLDQGVGILQLQVVQRPTCNTGQRGSWYMVWYSGACSTQWEGGCWWSACIAVTMTPTLYQLSLLLNQTNSWWLGSG